MRGVRSPLLIRWPDKITKELHNQITSVMDLLNLLIAQTFRLQVRRLWTAEV